jgi:two-component system sensor histidine kinase KdpD
LVPDLSRRPDPEELLRRVQAEERRERRGRLKVFLGYAPRVGKSFRMFDEGRRRKERGEDVVVASVQGEVTPDIQAIVSHLEAIPTLPERYAGREFQVLDIAGIFRRHPEICLIDGLANDNPPGSRNPQRWQDVENLLGRGIGVITAVNVQHIRERQDDVARVTGKRAAYSVPEAFLNEADDIEVVDAPPEALLGRGGDHQGLPDARQLGELRELALVLAANVVDRQLQGYLSAHGIAATWGVQERILVCLTPRSNAASMLQSGMRNARRFHGSLLAAYFEQANLSPEDRLKLEANLALARQLEAEVHCLKGRDLVEAVLAFAREQHVTQVFLGHTQRDQPRWWWHSPIDRLIEEATDFDLRLFPQAEQE